MISAADAREALQEKRAADRRQEQKEARERAARLEEIKARAHRDFEEELFKVEAAIQEAIANGKSETVFGTQSNTAGEVLGPLLAEKLTELGYTARHSFEHHEGYRGGYDEPGWDAYIHHSVTIKW